MPLLGAGCKGYWGEPVQARVWSCCVVVDPPGFDDPTRPGQAAEQVFVQAFIPEPAVEAFHESALLGLARGDVVPQHRALFLPAQDGV